MPNQSMYDRAVEIADDSMLAMLEAHAVPLPGRRSGFSLCDSKGREVERFAEADPSIMKAYEWLLDRGLVSPGKDAKGDIILLVKQNAAAKRGQIGLAS